MPSSASKSALRKPMWKLHVLVFRNCLTHLQKQINELLNSTLYLPLSLFCLISIIKTGRDADVNREPEFGIP